MVSPPPTSSTCVGEAACSPTRRKAPRIMVDARRCPTEASDRVREACDARGIELPRRAGQRQRQGGAAGKLEPRGLRARGRPSTRSRRCSSTSAVASPTSARARSARLVKICHNLMLGVVDPVAGRDHGARREGRRHARGVPRVPQQQRHGVGLHPVQVAGVREPRLHADVHAAAAAQGLRPRSRRGARARRAHAGRGARPRSSCRPTRRDRPGRRRTSRSCSTCRPPRPGSSSSPRTSRSTTAWPHAVEDPS